jgi:hypothetical protein
VKGIKTMADDLNQRGPRDRSRINTSEEWECRYWSQELGVTEQQLKQAVASVGNMASAVRKHLQGESQAGQRSPGSSAASGRSNKE